jgi:hypothetical protein
LIRAWPFKLNIIFSASQKKGIVILLLVGITIIQGQKYLAWALHPQYKLRQISEDLGKAFDQAAISGLWAPVLCLENKHRAYESYPSFINDSEDFLEQYKITHVIATDFFGGLEKNYYWNNFAEEMQKSKLLVKYPIWRGAAFLYDLHPDSETAPQENIMEAEMFTQSPGMPRYDPESSGQFAVSFQKGTPGFLSIASSGRKFTQGSHQATFRLKIEGNKGHEVQRIARIDVISSEQNRVLAVKNLMAADFSQEDTYQEFNLTFTLKRPAILDFRVYSDSVIPLWADNFRIETTSTQNVMKNR